MKLPKVWDVATPHEDIQKGQLDESVFGARFGEVLTGRAAGVYQNPAEFFSKTFITKSLSQLLGDVLLRLSGDIHRPCIRVLLTPFGGGKTHTLIGLYHTGKAPKVVEALLRETVLEPAGVKSIPSVKVAGLDGTDWDPMGGWKHPDGMQTRTWWGDIAYQLGGLELFNLVAPNDHDRIAPGAEKMRQVLEKAQPAIILIDEVAPYLTTAAGVNVGNVTLGQQTLTFLQQLTHAVAGMERVVLGLTLPASSEIQFYGEAAQEILHHFQTAAETLTHRLANIETPVAGDEIYGVVKTRLFSDPGSLKQCEEVIQTFIKDYAKHAGVLPKGITEKAYQEKMAKAYPFHPELIDLLYHRVSTLRKFQRTRGVLRLLALVVRRFYEAKPADGCLILPSHVDLLDMTVQNELVRLVDEKFYSVINSDIVSADGQAKAQRIEQELGTVFADKALCARLATTALLYSLIGAAEMKAGASDLQLRLAVQTPGSDPHLVPEALQQFEKRLHYFYTSDDGLHYFAPTPNLNNVIEEAEANIKDDVVHQKIYDLLKDKHAGSRFPQVDLWVKETNEVADDANLHLVIMNINQTWGAKTRRGTREKIKEFVIHCGTPFRNNPNALVFLVADEQKANDLKREVRTHLALEGLRSNKPFMDSLSPKDRKDLTDRAKKASDGVVTALFTCYRHIVLPEGKQPDVVDLQPEATGTKGKTLSEVVWERLTSETQRVLFGELTPEVVIEKAWAKDKSVVSTEEIASQFLSVPVLPMLTSLDVLRQAIRQGVRDGKFGYAESPSAEGISKDSLCFRQTLPTGVEFSKKAWLVSKNECEKLLPDVPPPPPPPPPSDIGLPPIELKPAGEVAKEVGMVKEKLVEQGIKTLPPLVIEAEGEQALAALTTLLTQLRMEVKAGLKVKAQVTIVPTGAGELPVSVLDKIQSVVNVKGYAGLKFGVKGQAKQQ
jgi:hypothetical protein